MRLLDAYTDPRAVSVLYELLAERPRDNWISHERMPTLEEHKAFVRSRPFRLWLLIVPDDLIDLNHYPVAVGAIEANDRNEMGVSILKRHQRKGYARAALTMFVKHYDPLPAIPAVRNDHWLANIAARNEGSKAFFRKMGFQPLQETYIL